MAANENRPDPRRLRYFDGLIMKEEEFILEQDYHIRMRRLHNRNLHDGGIISGLEVKLGNTPNEVLVTQGIALDRHFDQKFSEDVSRELVLTDDCEVDLSSYQSGDQVWIWVSYAEEFADVVPDRGGQEPIHIKETVLISHATNRPPNEGETDIPLAVVEIAAGGVVNQDAIKDTFEGDLIREKSAIKTDRVDVEVLSLRDPLIDDGNTPFLDGFRFEDTGDDGIVVSSDRTRFTGVVDVDTRLNVGTDASIDGNLTVIGNFAGRLPLGGVVAVFDYGGNLPATTNDITGDGFMRADGQPLPNTTVLYAMANGSALPTTRPDLTSEVFLMGATISGNTGGANSITVSIPEHSHAITSLSVEGQGLRSITGSVGEVDSDLGLNSHTHVIRSSAAAGNNDSWPILGTFVASIVSESPDRALNHTHSISGTVDVSGLFVDGTIGSGQSGDAQMDAIPHENRPSYVSAVYLIRVN